MNQEILNLIEMAVADGEITDKEREIILRKAETFGEDKDEVEMILEGKLAMIKKQTKPDVEKAGNVTKCPQCKAVVPSFTTRCESCGHEFRNIAVSSSIKTFFEKLEKIESNRDMNRGGIKDTLINNFTVIGIAKRLTADPIAKQKAELIRTFPIPNSKEDILEFLSLAMPRAVKTKIGKFGSIVSGASEDIVNNAFEEKCEQIIMKAGFAFKSDQDTLLDIQYYAKQLGIEVK